ncbi:helix-turn-helix transcriptional regulator [Gemmata sp. G18]|uniref:Helix-turn-helix transcriptional regulator n=1 Tax=Gemmata palustris TaxID=2822762 RepID=A0ABS5BTG1_9BACT|nr:helix-turn-helix transcriptional regulator [Gemmata palustris]MBP3956712.1 helix-turn-helix transcriptional regulator [Gemmata palustris]
MPMRIIDPTARVSTFSMAFTVRLRGEGIPVLVAEPNTFGDRLKALREKAKMTKYRLAQVSGVSQQTISQLEKPGGGDPSWETVKKLAHALGVSIDEFDTTEDDDKQPQAEPAPKKKPPKK